MTVGIASGRHDLPVVAVIIASLVIGMASGGVGATAMSPRVAGSKDAQYSKDDDRGGELA